MNTVHNAIYLLLEAVKREPRSTKKIQMLEQFQYKEELKKLMYLAYDPHVVFGITSKAIPPKRGGLVSEVDPDILEKILTIKGRNAKIEHVKMAISWLNPTARQYILAAIDKDLNIGVGIKTINKALGQTVSDFQLMLAHKQTEERFNNNFSELEWVYYNLKVDGVRCEIDVRSKDEIIFKSRSGLEMEEFLVENIRYEIQKNYYKFAGRRLDAEIHSNNFQKFMRIYRRKNVDLDSIYIRNSTRLAIFDLIDCAEMNLEERVSEMKRIKESIGDMRFISFLEYFKTNNVYADIGVIARQYIRDGEEGIIIKHPFKPYEFKRSNYWLKFKNKETMDLVVTGFYKGEPNTEFENALGGLIFDYNGEELRCGSGFSRDERNELWKNPESLIGETVEISFMEETKTGSLRHPVFERFRFDK
jgi:DNA ligase-1